MCISLLSDAVTAVMIVTVSGVGLSLLIIFIVMTCFSNHKRWDHCHTVLSCEAVMSFILNTFLFCSSISRLKGHFWPIVPDPANSSIKKWTSESSEVWKINQCKIKWLQATSPVKVTTALLCVFIWMVNHIILCLMKGVASSDKPTEDYHLTQSHCSHQPHSQQH